MIKSNPFNPVDQRCFCNSVGPDQMADNETAHQDLHCLQVSSFFTCVRWKSLSQKLRLKNDKINRP